MRGRQCQQAQLGPAARLISCPSATYAGLESHYAIQCFSLDSLSMAQVKRQDGAQFVTPCISKILSTRPSIARSFHCREAFVNFGSLSKRHASHWRQMRCKMQYQHFTPCCHLDHVAHNPVRCSARTRRTQLPSGGLIVLVAAGRFCAASSHRQTPICNSLWQVRHSSGPGLSSPKAASRHLVM